MIRSRGYKQYIILSLLFLSLISLSLYSSTHFKFNSEEITQNPTINQRSTDSESKLFPCDDYTPQKQTIQRGQYLVLLNYFRAAKSFRCDESITYTTHADWTFLDNLLPLLKRWQGPLSIAMYSPGSDFDTTVKYIHYLRECTSSTLIKDLVSFHIFFDNSNFPIENIQQNPEIDLIDCVQLKESLSFDSDAETFKKSNNLSYPVNVARNIAREMSTTHYVLPSDIELYPNPNLIPTFFEMIQENDTLLQQSTPKVFVLPIFEVESYITKLPFDKPELKILVRNGTAIPFHKYVCPNCHWIPNFKHWFSRPFDGGLSTFYVGKRHRPYHHWEPIYIGTKLEPHYDERLTWEGQKDKMTQAYIMCLLDYEFHVLDNAFLIHRPGIKRRKTMNVRIDLLEKQKKIIHKTILPELNQLYGTNPNCVL